MELQLRDHIQQMRSSVLPTAQHQAGNAEPAEDKRKYFRAMIRAEIASTANHVMLHLNHKQEV